MSDCPSRLMLAKSHADELDAEERVALSNHIARCVHCQEALASLKENVVYYERRQDAHLQALEAAIANAPAHQTHVVPLRRSKTLTMAAAVLAAAAVIILGIAFFYNVDAGAGMDTVGYKGGFAVSVVAKRGTNQFKVTDGAVLMANDALRFQVQASKKGYLYIFNIDSKGAVTALYPFSNQGNSAEAMEISDAGDHTLAGSIVLDDADGREYLVALFSESRFRTNIISDHVAKRVIRSNKKTGDIAKMLKNELSDSASTMDVCVIAIEKR